MKRGTEGQAVWNFDLEHADSRNQTRSPHSTRKMIHLPRTLRGWEQDVGVGGWTRTKMGQMDSRWKREDGG